MADPRSARDQLRSLADRGVEWTGWPAVGADYRPAAVLILFGRLDARPAHHSSSAVRDDLDVLLVTRAASLTHHAGQVAFPGGRVDPHDAGVVAAALREAQEETGLDPTGVEVLGTLGELALPVSRHRVVPVLGWWARPSPVGVVDEAESAHVFRAAVADLLDPDNRATVTLRRSQTADRAIAVHRGPGFVLGEHLVWGFTAVVLDALFDALGWTEPWDPTRTVPAPVT